MSKFKLPKYVYSNEHLLGILSELGVVMAPQWLIEENELMSPAPLHSLLLTSDDNSYQHYSHNHNPNFKSNVKSIVNRYYNINHTTGTNTGKFTAKKSESYDNAARNIELYTSNNICGEDSSLQSNVINTSKSGGKGSKNSCVLHKSLDETSITQSIITSIDVKDGSSNEKICNTYDYSDNINQINLTNDSDKNSDGKIQKIDPESTNPSENSCQPDVSSKNESDIIKCNSDNIKYRKSTPEMKHVNNGIDNLENNLNGVIETKRNRALTTTAATTTTTIATTQSNKKSTHKLDPRPYITKDKVQENFKNTRSKPNYDQKSKTNTNTSLSSGRNTNITNRYHINKKNNNPSKKYSKPINYYTDPNNLQKFVDEFKDSINVNTDIESKQTLSLENDEIVQSPILSIDEIMREQMEEKMIQDRKNQQEYNEKIRKKKEKDNFWKEIQVEAISIEQLELEEKAKSIPSINNQDINTANDGKNNSTTDSSGKFWEHAMKFY